MKIENRGNRGNIEIGNRKQKIENMENRENGATEFPAERRGVRGFFFNQMDPMFHIARLKVLFSSM